MCLLIEYRFTLGLFLIKAQRDISVILFIFTFNESWIHTWAIYQHSLIVWELFVLLLVKNTLLDETRDAPSNVHIHHHTYTIITIIRCMAWYLVRKNRKRSKIENTYCNVADDKAHLTHVNLGKIFWQRYILKNSEKLNKNNQTWHTSTNLVSKNTQRRKVKQMQCLSTDTQYTASNRCN